MMKNPPDDADFIFLPGGYPELHLPTLSRNRQFLAGLTKAATANIPIYGECGGYMVLGTGITDASGNRFDMAGLLDVETSFANKKRHLGYRKFTPVEPFFWDGPFLGHEFHYTNVFQPAERRYSPPMTPMTSRLAWPVCVKGSVAGSYLHIIAQS
jgi:cobyrinic acid a,c-diamide synthase